MMTNRVQWLVLASALCAAQGLMTGCNSCGDGDRKPAVDGGGDGGGGTDDDSGSTNPDGGSGTAGIKVDPKAGLITTEGGAQAVFTIVLTSAPTANVTVGLSSSDEGEGTLKVSSLVFTPSNWNAPQQVTVTGVDDDATDGSVEYSIITAAAQSDDDAYKGLNADDVQLSNTDNETAGVSVTALPGLETTEAGGTATFSVALNSKPRGDVVIGLTSSNTAEGTVAPAALTFTAENWAAAQLVTVTGVDDTAADGPQTYSIVTTASSAEADYDGIEVADVTLINTDDDSAAFRIMPLTGLRTSEGGDQATFSVALNTAPTAPVTITLVSGDLGEVTIAPATLTFTPENWSGLQTVIVTGVNDDEADGAQPFQIITNAATSADSRYAGINPPDVSGSNVDNDTAGVTIRLPDPLRTAEDGTQAAFTVELNARPTADVTISFATTDGDEVSIAPTSLVFTQADWNSRKTVTLTGVNEDVTDGEQTFTITVTTASADAAYNARDIPNIVGRNVDNDSAGVTVSPVSRETRENGQQAQFSVRLNSRPASNVVIGVTSLTLTEVTASTNSLVFTPTDWNSPHVVTLTGVNDDVIDGNRSVTIVLADSISADADYNGINVPDVIVINEDDDTPALRVSKLTGLVTTESGGQDSFTVALATQPTANVRLTVTSLNTAEATVSSGLLTFTPTNWNAPQGITVTGQNDAVADGPQPYFVALGPADSTDTHYLGLAVQNVGGSNTDNDSAGITLVGATGLVTSETGTQRSFTVVLNSEPRGDVTIPIVSLTPTEGIAAPASLLFTAGNWSAPQTVFVTGVNDLIADGPQDYAIRIGPSVSTDTAYVAVPVANVIVTNTDNDTAGITVLPLSRLDVTEGGTQDSFTVVLNSQPTADVTIAISSSNPAEATVGTGSLTFTAVNWASAQTVLVTGRGDLVQDGDQDFAIHIGPAVSTDAGYSARAVPDLAGTNQDLDSPAIRITGTNLTTTEAGGQTSFTVVLLDEPTADVVLPILSNDLSEGVASPASLTFTAANWDAPQLVTITGANDNVEDGNQPYFILVGPAVSTDVNYGGRVVPNVRVTNNDNDTAGVTLADTAGLTTTEAGAADTFTIVLHSEPTSNVVFSLSSNDLSEGTVSPATITFTPVNWNAPQTVTVTGVNDAVQDGSPTYQIVIGSPTTNDARYAVQVVPNVDVVNTDNDTAGINVVAGALVTTEAGGSASFSVVLNSEPTANVTIPLSSNDLTEGTLSAASLTFTALNWNVPQSVTINGVDDAVQDGPQPYSVVFAAVTSGDPNYVALAIPSTLSVTNTDNDTAGITVVSPGGGLTTTEAGVTATFTVVLNSQPIAGATVAFALVTSDPTETSVAPIGGLLFTDSNWSVPQTVTVTGVDDFVDDGNQPFAITVGPAVSGDPLYDTLTVPNVTGTNTDNDTFGFVLSRTSITTYEFGVSTTFTVRLNSEPTAAVDIGVHSSVLTEASVAPSVLTFTAGNWNVDQTVTVTGVDDALIDGSKAYVIVLDAVTSLDGVYNGQNPTDVTGTNVEAALSCDEWLTVHPSFTSGIYPLDTDRTGPNAVFQAYCDMATDGGGWTLLSWTANSEVGTLGAPYPGLAFCSDPLFNCVRGSGVPSESVNALFDVSGELAQGQTTTLALKATFGLLGSYEFAGSFVYGSLAALALDTGSACAGVVTGQYNNLVNTAASDGVPVFLNSGLRRDDNPAFTNFTVDNNNTPYQWSVGNRGDYCTLNGVAPSSFLGTFDDGQYGPGVPSAAGSYSVWVR